MRDFRRAYLTELLGPPGGPAVSIYLPARRADETMDQLRLRLRALVGRARQLLERLPSGEADPTLARLEELEVETVRAEPASGGLALFAAPETAHAYRLPGLPPELVVVDRSFHVRPLLAALQEPDRFWVLELGADRAHLWQGDAEAVHRVQLPGLPENLAEAFGFEFGRDYQIIQRKRSNAGRVRAGSGSFSPVFHGHGMGANDREPELRQLFGRVDQAVREELSGESAPVVLACVSEHVPLYRSVSRLENLAEEYVSGSVAHWSPAELHDAAWPIARKAADAEIERRLEEWERDYGRGKGEADLANLGRLAVAGRLRALLTERGRRVWGRLDPATGAVELLREGGEDPGPEVADLLDDLSEVVLSRGGEVLSVPADRMPTRTGAAGLLR